MRNAYNEAYEEAQWDDKVTEDDLITYMMLELYEAKDDRIKIACNRRENFDDRGDFVPKDAFYKVVGISKARFEEKNAEKYNPPMKKTWVCDKCMKINLVGQNCCDECKDGLDENDEIL